MQLTLSEDNERDIERLLKYLYSGSFESDTFRENRSIKDTADDASNIYILADKYEIRELKEQAFSKLKWTIGLY